MSIQVCARVVGAVDAAVELHEHPLRPRRRALEAVHAERDLVVRARPRAGSARRCPRCRGARSRRRRRSATRRRRRCATASRSGSPGQVTIECRHSPPAPGCQRGRDGCSNSAAVELERRAAVAALEQHARVAARVDDAVRLAGLDHPDPLERRVAALGQLDALGLLPPRRRDRPRTRSSARRTARSPTRAGGRSARRASAYSTGSPANARAVTSNGAPGSPSSANRPFLVPTSSSVIAIPRRAPEGRRSCPRLRPACPARRARRSRTR